ncbi:hypothetical protein tb265_50090 [Gemmatimonadetes bacterium T265]|nr:hypothetical protein tb265_50090 [Gemmatimonadetes bacterium T265]
MTAGMAGREAVAATANRVALTRAAWQAEECAARALAAADAAMADAGTPDVANPTSALFGIAPEQLARRWRTLDTAVARSPLVPRDRGCAVRLTAAGTTVALTLGDAAEGDAMHRLLGALRVAPPLADSLVDALLDWRDADDTPRAAGAEADWYRTQGRPPPRNAPFAAAAELDRVRGFDSTALDARVPGLHAAVQARVGVDDAPVDLSHAPREVLLALPGMTPDAVAAILALRARTPAAVVDLASVAARLPRDAAAAFGAQLPALQTRAVPEPAAWIVTASGVSGTPAVTAVVELRVARVVARIAVVRRRSWVE